MLVVKKLMATLSLALAFGAYAAEKCTDCLAFSSASSFTLALKRGYECTTVAPSLEWSSDQETWTSMPWIKQDDDTWAISPVSAVQTSGSYVLYVRGSGNTAFAEPDGELYEDSAASFILNGTAIACSGNVETLLDWATVKAGNHPTMGAKAFYRLFAGCDELTMAPTLPAATLTPRCYGEMFAMCSSLVTPPELSATTLAANCYMGMFMACESLMAVPDLPATTLVNSCYAHMFHGCGSLVVNTNAPGKAWSIPAAAADSAAKAELWSDNMFSGTSGNFTTGWEDEDYPWEWHEDPLVPGTTYYVKSATDEQPAVEIWITAPVATNGYDGTAHSVGGFAFTASEDGYTAEDFVFSGTSNATGTAVGEYRMNLSAADFKPASGSSYKKLTVHVVQDGELVINRRTVTLTSSSETWDYDGLAHSNTTVTAEGFVTGEGVTCRDFATVTGPDASAENAFAYDPQEGTDLGNYTVTVVKGTLTVRPIPMTTVVPQSLANATVKVCTNGVELTGDGGYVVVRGSTVKVVYEAADGYEFAGGEKTAEVTFTADGETASVPADQLPAAPVKKQPCTECLTFSSAAPFSISMEKGSSCSVTPTVQWSTNRFDWNSWDYASVSAAPASGGYAIYVRGTGNSAFASAFYVGTYDEDSCRFSLSGSAGIACSGNVETLLDWATVKAGNHPAMDANAFVGLFFNCSQLTTPPSLPSVSLAKACYAGMFANCAALTSLPELPATVLADCCYYEMFRRCSALVVNTEAPGVAWSIPTGATAGSDSMKSMLGNTGGTFCGSPVPGTTYYVASAAQTASVVPQEVEHASVSVFIGETELVKEGDAYEVSANASVTVVYTADDGYAFTNELKSVSVTFTASDAVNAVPAELLPAAPTALEECTECLVFSSAEPFTVATAKGLYLGQVNKTPILQWSTNRIDWTTWDFTAIPAAGTADGYRICFRGKGNTTLAGANDEHYTTTLILNGSEIACSGNAETLLDWKTVKAGNHPAMGDYAFYGLFSGCTALTTVPDLPATTLAKDSYRNMFYGCTSLKAPCALPATALPDECYQNMFAGCAGISIRLAPPGVAWSIPAEATVGVNSLTSMFAGTDCDDASTLNAAEKGKTYYIYSALELVSVVPQTVEHTTVRVFVGEDEIEAKGGAYAVRSNDTVKVVYTPDDGFEFDLERKPVEITFVADAAVNAVPADKLPEPPTPYAENDNCIAFTGAKPFTVALVNDSSAELPVTLEWSTNRTHWTAWNLAAIEAAERGGEYALYLRGSGNAGFRDISSTDGYYGYTFVLTGEEIRCSGEVETLLDWETVKEGRHPTLGKCAFRRLFYGCAALKTAPSVRVGKMKDGACKEMFKGCSGLTELPEVSMENVEPGCCESMFDSCTSLVVNTNGVGIAWSLAFGGDYAFKDMFLHTAGSFRGTPVRDDVYYVYSALPLVKVAPQAVEHTTVRVFADAGDGTGEREIALVDESFAVRSNETVRVVYRADWGYGWEGNDSEERTIKVTLVADKAVNEVPDGQLPAVPVQKEICTDCLTFSSADEFDLDFFQSDLHGRSPEPVLEWSTNGFYWTAWTRVGEGRGYTRLTSCPTAGGHVIYVRGTGNAAFAKLVKSLYEGDDPGTQLVYTRFDLAYGTASCSGNLETLLDWRTVRDGGHPAMDAYAFTRVFSEVTSWKSFAELILGAETLTPHCYERMFANSLVAAAPALPVETLAENCYAEMFANCSLLTEAPALPAETLAAECYAGMFRDCSRLTNAPALPAETLVARCYQRMFSGCSSLTAVPELPAETLAENCYEEMFAGCTALTSVPLLMAKTLAEASCRRMFKGCTAIVDVAPLAAKALPNTSCDGMFQDCSALIVNFDGIGLPWSVPADATVGKDWNTDMFKGTAGTLSEVRERSIHPSGLEIQKSPFPGVTYYVNSAPWSQVTPQEVPDTSVRVYCGEDEIPLHAGGYAVRRGDTVNVVYTALDGTRFPGNVETVEVELVAGEQYVSLPDDLVPADPLHEGYDWIAFTAGGSFSVALAKDSGTPSLEWSANRFDWTAWDGTAVASDGSELYFRGSGNKAIGAHFVLTGTGIACYGSVEALLDWRTCRALGHPSMSPNAFEGLFRNCTALVEAPYLTGVLLTKDCYASMFAGCSALLLNKRGEGLAWSVPADAQTADGWATDIFAGIAGDAAGMTPKPGVELVLAGAPLATVSVPQVASTTVRVFANGRAIAAGEDGYAVRRGAAVRVVYAADDGFILGDNTTERVVAFIADSESVAVPAEKVPAAFELSGTDCLTFSSVQPFTLAYRNGEYAPYVRFEWSVDGRLWTSWEAGGNDSVTSAAIPAEPDESGAYVLYLRGTRNNAFSSYHSLPIAGPTATELASSFVLNGTNVYCHGNIETLLDWKVVRAGKHPVMYDYALYRLFADCTALVSLPELPAFALESHCYCQMFDGCSNLVVNASGSGSAWTIPGDAAWYETYEPGEYYTPPQGLDNAPGWGEDMFRGTAGDLAGLTGAPVPGSVYRVASAAATFAEREVAHVQQELSATAGCIGDEVTVTFTAEKGYRFADGTTTCVVTAAFDKVVSTVRDELLPTATWCFDRVIGFSSANPFTVAMKRGASCTANVALEWSADGDVWTAWDFAAVESAMTEDGYVLYFRGTGNTAFASGTGTEDALAFVLDGTDIACSGSIETLLDWGDVFDGNHPEAGDYAFSGLFRGCAALTMPPELTMETMTKGCYAGMFGDCSTLVVNVDGYGLSWSIPSGIEAADGWNADMFAGTAGTFTGAPEAGVTYYLAGVRATVTPQELAHATYSVYVGEEEIYAPYAVPFGTTARVVYTAKDGYAFEGGQTTVEVEILVSDQSAYAVEMQEPELLSTEYVVFSAATPFVLSMTMSGESPALEVSTNGFRWTAWNGAAVTGDVVRVRGTGNRTLGGAAFALEGEGVACSGNVEALLDWKTVQSGDHPKMDDTAFFCAFAGCTALVSAPELPSTALAPLCYTRMFEGCTSLVSAPELPATELSIGCYLGMFKGCTSLTAAPELPATVHTNTCYMQMFENCTSLTSAASLVHVRRMASESCSEMYRGCSALVAAADLDIYGDGDAVKNLLAPSCFAGMYENCTSITNFCIPGICCAEQCYERMFKGCTALVSVGGWVRDPLFYSAREMFRGCTSLRSYPELHQQALAKGCYAYMFADCTSLIALPDLPEVLLEESCYEAMFMNCSNIIVNLEGPGVKWGLPNYRCSGDFDHSPVHIMLYGTGGDFTGEPARDTVYYVYSALPFVTVTPQDVPNTTKRVFVYRTQAEEYEELELADGSCTVRRDEQVKVTYTVTDGYWTYPNEATSYDAVFTASIEGDNPVPEDILLAPTPTPPCAECLAFTSANPFTLAQTGAANLEWSTNRITWAALGKTVVRAEASGEASFAAYVRGTGNSALGTTFVLDGTAIACSGNAETLLDRKQAAAGEHPPMYYSAFENLFAGCTALTTAPELPATELVFDCYRGMFSGCTSLVAAPALPARQVTRNCYQEMFKNCTSLVAAPELPAENTAVECYREMFAGCSSLKAAPALPVDDIVSPSAYYGMFRDCTSLTDATELPALEVRDGGYAYMFSGCTALTNAPSTLPATLIGNYVQYEHVGSYAGMFQNCSSLVEPPARIEKESDRSFIMMFQGCTSLVHTPAMPEGIGNYAADRMFQNCTSITGGCENIRVGGNFSCRQMFENCTSLKTAPSVYVLSGGGESVCESMFSGCTSLKTANITFHDYLNVGKDNAFHSMFKGCVALTKPVGRIPMWKLGKSCCESMYEGCVSIEDVTTIAATEFGQDCCRNMFKGCTGVFLHAVQGNAKAWSISSGASCGSGWNADMFAGTAGSIATVVGSPVPGDVYGLATELTIVPPTVSNATYTVYCNGVETNKAKPGDRCLVVYTGEGDYRFSPATNEWGTVVTAVYAESGVISFDVPELYFSYQYLVPTFGAGGAFVGCLRKYTPPTVVLTGKRTDAVSLDGWYVVSNACELTKGATVDGVVNLVLLDGSALKAKAADADAAAIDVGARAGSSLTIFAQSEDLDSMGALTATATAGAGIGGGRDETGLRPLSPVTISGGRVTATSQSGAGIGGGAGAAGVGIDVNGGLVTATSQTGAGIGGGTNGCGRVITIRGGTVVASGSSGGADIGGGQGAAAPDSDISILGGSVWASTIGRAPVNARSQAVYPAVITNVTASPADVKGLDGYGVNGLYPVDGQLCLYLPNGVYAFWADDDFHRLVVAEGTPTDAVNPPLDPLATYGSADAAQEQLGLAVLVPPEAAEGVAPVRQYDAMFDKTVVAGSAPGTFEIAFTLKKDVQAEVENALNDEEVLSELAETVTSEEPSVTVRTKPGLYYGMVGATDPAGLQEATVPAGGWVLGTGAEMKIMGEKPAGATNRSFYQLRAVASPD